MVDTDTLIKLVPKWLAAEDRGGTSPASFWRWLRKHGVNIGNARAYRVVNEYFSNGKTNAALIPKRVREWEALGKNGQIVKLSHVTYDVDVDWREVIRAAVAEEVAPLPPAIPAKPGSLFAVLSFPDIHIGQLSWGRETGQNYDSSIAERLYMEAASNLIDYLRAVGVGKVLYIVGNDLMHVDGEHGNTTNGTPQVVDSRWQYMFSRARKISEAVINELVRFSEVDVVIMPGNHDGHLAYAIGHVLDARYAEHEHVRVDIEPSDRKYFVEGKLLFGITHGDRVKDTDLPLLMAEEASEYWGSASWKEWLLGHRHRKQVIRHMDVNERIGVQLTYLPSLKALDKWHYKKGFYNRQAAEVRVYDPNVGILHSYKPYYPNVRR